MAFVPHHTVVGDGARVAVVLHGILGSHRNWRSFALRLATARRDWRFVLVDLRNHGESSGAPPPHTLATAAADLDALGPIDAVLGHSFGGKVALQYAATRPVGQVWVLDAAPGLVGDDSGSLAAPVVAALGRVPVPLASRGDLAPAMPGFSQNLVAWLGTSLRSTPEGFVWKFDLAAIEEMLADYRRVDLWPVVERGAPKVHVVRAVNSEVWGAQDLARLATTPAVRHDLDAGHWLHVENLAGLLAVVGDHL